MTSRVNDDVDLTCNAFYCYSGIHEVTVDSVLRAEAAHVLDARADDTALNARETLGQRVSLKRGESVKCFIDTHWLPSGECGTLRKFWSLEAVTKLSGNSG